MLYSFYKAVKSFDSEKSKFTNYCGIAMLRSRSRFIKQHTNRPRLISLETLKRRKGLSNPLVLEEPDEGSMVRLVNILRKRIEMLPPHKARMLRMRAEGSTLEEIAAELGVTKQRVWRIIGDEIKFMTQRMNRS
jgi:RNA polymerase sigma factor (sigma-70 family)